MRPARGRLRLAATLLGTSLAAAGCGDQGGAQALGDSQVGSVAPLVQCRDWNTGDDDEKLATIEEVRAAVDLEDSAVKMPSLSDDEARELFDNLCGEPYAATFKLYRIYSRAAGFQSLLEPYDG